MIYKENGKPDLDKILGLSEQEYNELSDKDKEVIMNIMLRTQSLVELTVENDGSEQESEV